MHLLHSFCCTNIKNTNYADVTWRHLGFIALIFVEKRKKERKSLYGNDSKTTTLYKKCHAGIFAFDKTSVHMWNDNMTSNVKAMK